MVPTQAEGLPSLALDLVTAEQLTMMWSGAQGPPAWRGRLGDGGDLTIERGVAGDVLFSDGDRARHRLHPSGRLLASAVQHDGVDWQRVLLTKVLSSISVMRGYEALHASAVVSPWGAVVIAAPTSMGKTTLALELMLRGWPLLSDDVLALAADPDEVLAYPGTPHMNLASSSSERTAYEEIGPTLALLAGERWVAADQTAREPHPIRAICLFERSPGLSLDLQVLPPNPLPLAPYMLGLPEDAERERARFELYADLMGSVTLLRLTCGVTVRPSRLADLVEQALVDRPAAVALGAAR